MIYSAYGLGISASHSIPRLAGAPAALSADIRIELNARPAWFDESLPARTRYSSAYVDTSGAPALTVTELATGCLRFKYSDGVDFFIDGSASQIWVDWQTEALTLDDVSSYFLGPVMGVVLCMRRRTCLHASGVVVDGSVVAILGPPGAGKSTTAAAFGALGCAIVSDDVLALSDGDPGFMVYPGYPRLRLWPSALTALSDLGHLPALPTEWSERRYHLDINRAGYTFQTTPLPLGAIYVVAPRSASESAPFFQALPGHQSLMALVANTFAGRVLDRELSAREFDAFGRIAETVPVRRVTPHQDVRRLPELCEAVYNDFRRHTDKDPASTLKTRVGA